MARYFVWVQVWPINLPEGVRRILAVRTVSASSPTEAAGIGLQQVRTDLVSDLSPEQLSEATFKLSEVSKPAWFNFRRPNTNFVLEGPPDD
jgi:hypothetical protein